MIRVVLHHHLNTVKLFSEKHAGMVVGKGQRRKRKEQIGRLFQVFINAVRRPDQEHDISRKTIPERIRKLDRIHQFALFGQNDAFVFGFREFFVKKCRFLCQRLHAVVYLGLLELHDLEREHPPTQSFDILVDLVGNERRTSTPENC